MDVQGTRNSGGSGTRTTHPTLMKTTGKPNPDAGGLHNGRWTKLEHENFLLGLQLYGREWKKVAEKIQTRTSAQIRSHAQKYFAKLAKTDDAALDRLPPRNNHNKKDPVMSDPPSGNLYTQAAHLQANAPEIQARRPFSPTTVNLSPDTSIPPRPTIELGPQQEAINQGMNVDLLQTMPMGLAQAQAHGASASGPLTHPHVFSQGASELMDKKAKVMLSALYGNTENCKPRTRPAWLHDPSATPGQVGSYSGSTMDDATQQYQQHQQQANQVASAHSQKNTADAAIAGAIHIDAGSSKLPLPSPPAKTLPSPHNHRTSIASTLQMIENAGSRPLPMLVQPQPHRLQLNGIVGVNAGGTGMGISEIHAQAGVGAGVAGAPVNGQAHVLAGTPRTTAAAAALVTQKQKMPAQVGAGAGAGVRAVSSGAPVPAAASSHAPRTSLQMFQQESLQDDELNAIHMLSGICRMTKPTGAPTSATSATSATSVPTRGKQAMEGAAMAVKVEAAAVPAVDAAAVDAAASDAAAAEMRSVKKEFKLMKIEVPDNPRTPAQGSIQALAAVHTEESPPTPPLMTGHTHPHSPREPKSPTSHLTKIRTATDSPVPKKARK